MEQKDSIVHKYLNTIAVYLQVKKNAFHLFSGAVAGATSRTFVAPIERVIILRQTKNMKYYGENLLKMILNMYKNEGIRGWFKGNGANCIRITPFQAIEFYSFDYYSHYLGKIISQNNTAKYLICGALAGMTASTCVYPIDLVKTVLAVQTDSHTKYKGIFHSIRTICRQTGFFSLYRGWGMTMCGIAPYASLKLTCYQTLKNLFYGNNYNKKELSTLGNLGLGAFSGCFALTITYPTDLLRRRVQIMVFRTEKGKRPSVPQIIKEIIRKEGVFKLYNGLVASYVKVFPSTALAFAINEKLKQLLKVPQMKI